MIEGTSSPIFLHIDPRSACDTVKQRVSVEEIKKSSRSWIHIVLFQNIRSSKMLLFLIHHGRLRISVARLVVM